MSGRSKTKGVYFRDGTAYIRYQDEHGTDVRESTKQRSSKVAEGILAKRKTEVAMRQHFPIARVRCRHLHRARRLLVAGARLQDTQPVRVPLSASPGVLREQARSRHHTRRRRCIPGAPGHRAEALSVERQSPPHDRERHLQLRRETREFDRNPVAAVRQRPEPPGRDRIVSPAEFRILWDKAEGDREMRAFLALAGTTTMRKGEILSLRWEHLHLGDAPYATLVRTKTGHQRHVPIPQSIVKMLNALPSHGTGEYLFPSRPTARCPKPQRPYRWDFGKQFRALAKAAGIQNVRIHDLRHAGATILMTLGVPDAIVRKVTGHRSRELERYQHLTPELRALTVNLIATELFRGSGPGRNEKVAHLPAQCAAGVSLKNLGSANMLEPSEMLAGSTGLEPAASGVTGRRSNQLNYDPLDSD